MAEAQKKYNKTNMKCYSSWLNRKYDADLIAIIESQKNKNGYIVNALYAYSGAKRCQSNRE